MTEYKSIETIISKTDLFENIIKYYIVHYFMTLFLICLYKCYRLIRS